MRYTQPALDLLRNDCDAILDLSPFTAIRDADTGVLAGDIGMWVRDHDGGVLEFGYSVHPTLHRRGIGTAAVATAIAFARCRLRDANMIHCVCIDTAKTKD